VFIKTADNSVTGSAILTAKPIIIVFKPHYRLTDNLSTSSILTASGARFTANSRPIMTN